jgi:putative ECF transporter S component (TIGR02185 family)
MSAIFGFTKCKEIRMKKPVVRALLLSVLLIVVQLLVGKIPIQSYLYKMVFSAAVVCLLCAPVVYKLLLSPVPWWCFAVYSVLAGGIYTVIGYWYVGLYIFLIGLLCVPVMRPGAENFRSLAMGWTLYSGLFTGMSILPVLLFWKDYSAKALASGMSGEHLQAYYAYYSNPSMIAVIVVVTALGGLVGMLVSRKVFGATK